jgi:hypothetical protein
MLNSREIASLIETDDGCHPAHLHSERLADPNSRSTTL